MLSTGTKKLSQLKTCAKLSPPNEVTTPVNNGKNHEYSNFGYFENNFFKLEELGKGAYGVVVKVRNRTDEKEYAIKQIKVKGCDVDDVVKEIEIFSKLDHHHIVKYYHAWKEELTPIISNEKLDDLKQIESEYETDTSDFVTFGTASFECEISSEEKGKIAIIPLTNIVQEYCVYIQMESCLRTTLKGWLSMETYKNRDPIRAALICANIAEALGYMHTRTPTIIHRDLSPGNIFLTKSIDNFVPKIGDFGLAKVVDLNAGEAKSKCAKGTQLYMSPEMLDKKPYNHKIDIFALGIIYFELLVWFNTKSERAKVLETFLQKSILPIDFIARFPLESKLISKLISKYPEQRPSAAEVSEELTFHRKQLLELRNHEASLSVEDRWWEFHFSVLKSVSGSCTNSGIEALGQKKPEIKPALIFGNKVVLYDSNVTFENVYQNTLTENKSRAGIVNCAIPQNCLTFLQSLSELFLFEILNLNSVILETFLENLKNLEKFRCFQSLPNDVSINVNNLNPNSCLKEFYLRGVKVQMLNASTVQFTNVKVLGLFDCVVNEELICGFPQIFPQCEEVYVLNCKKSSDNTPLVNSSQLEVSFLPCAKLMFLHASFILMFGDCEVIKTQFFSFTKRDTMDHKWSCRHIEPKSFRYFISKCFCYEEVEKLII